MGTSANSLPTPETRSDSVFNVAVCAGRPGLTEALLRALRAEPVEDNAGLVVPGGGIRPSFIPNHSSGLCAAYPLEPLAQKRAPQDAIGARGSSSSDRSHPDDELHSLPSLAGRVDSAILILRIDDGLSESMRFLAYALRQLGVRSTLFVVDMPGTDHRETHRFVEIATACRAFSTRIDVANSACIPVRLSDIDNGNVSQRSSGMSFYNGPTVSQHLLALCDMHCRSEIAPRPMRTRVEATSVDPEGSSCISGSVLSGTVRVGDLVRIQPAGLTSSITRLQVAGRDTSVTQAGVGVMLSLAGTYDVKPGDMIATANAPLQLADQFQATVAWTGAEPMLRGRTYRLQSPAHSTPATIAPLKYKLDLSSLEHLAADRLFAGETGVCELELAHPILFDPAAENEALSTFVLVDPITDRKVGFGLLSFALRRAHNVHLHGLEVSREIRAQQKKQKPRVLWLTGLSGSGKSTIANLVDKKLYSMGRHSYVLDGDNVRHGLTKDLGFTAEDRVENIRRVAEVAKLMVDAGLIVLTAFISPFRSERHMARNLMLPGEFIEVYVDTPLELAEQRDPKGLYRKARRGEIKNFTGLDSPYEPPQTPEIHIQTMHNTPEQAADLIIEYLERSVH